MNNPNRCYLLLPGDFGHKILNSPDNTTSYYYLKDHQGNIRATVKDDGARVTRDDYYPFGFQMSAMNAGDPYDKLKYSSKELDEEGGLYKYHFQFRDYDPKIGRWNVVDPIHQTEPNLSPYNYCANDPVNKIDLLGLTIFWIDMGNGQLWFKNNFNGIQKHALWNDGNQTWDEFNPLDYIKNNYGDQTKSWAENLFDGTVDMWRTVWEGGIGGDYVHSVNKKGITTVRGTSDNGTGRQKNNSNDNNEKNSRTDNANENNSVTKSWAELIFGPKAEPGDSYLWKLFRGTGNISEDANRVGSAASWAVVGGTAVIGAEAVILPSVKNAVSNISQIRANLRIDPAHHTFKLFGRKPHLQMNMWIKGVKGSGRTIFRIPFFWR